MKGRGPGLFLRFGNRHFLCEKILKIDVHIGFGFATDRVTVVVIAAIHFLCLIFVIFRGVEPYSKRRHYRTVHQETHQETVKSESKLSALHLYLMSSSRIQCDVRKGNHRKQPIKQQW